MSKIYLAAAAISLFMGAAQAGTITNNFTSGEAPAGWTGPEAPIFGGSGFTAGSFHALGVTFTFSDTANEVYGASVGVGGIAQGLQGPGDTTVTLTFDSPSTFLSFDMTFAPIVTPTVRVVIDRGSPLSFTTSDPGGSGIASGAFSSGPISPFSTAVISFDSGAAMYALGNLTYTVPDSSGDPPDPPAAPEPASITLLGLAMVAVGAARRARRARC